MTRITIPARTAGVLITHAMNAALVILAIWAAAGVADQRRHLRIAEQDRIITIGDATPLGRCSADIHASVWAHMVRLGILQWTKACHEANGGYQ